MYKCREVYTISYCCFIVMTEIQTKHYFEIYKFDNMVFDEYIANIEPKMSYDYAVDI